MDEPDSTDQLELTSAESGTRAEARPGSIIWRNVLGIVLMHGGAVGALFFYSRAGLWTLVAMAILTCQFGITLGYHRLLSHRSYKVPRWLERGLALAGCLAFQAGPIAWVATHRCHHRHADDKMDPHSPKVSFFWSHIGWTVVRYAGADSPMAMRRLTPDLASDTWFGWLQGYFVLVNLALAAVLWIAGWFVDGVPLGWSLLLWGFCLRVVVIWHFTFCVNSASHVWGYRTYDTKDTSRNNWWVALLTFGEGWHNNHHADQRSAAHGHRWWEIDTTYLIIRLLARLGLATKVMPPSPRLQALRLGGTSSESR